jgi:hypothetical protein
MPSLSQKHDLAKPTLRERRSRTDVKIGRFSTERLLLGQTLRYRQRGKIEQLRCSVSMSDSIKQEALQILDSLYFKAFEQC